ncbi:hypothetical protein MAR_027250, partial [Mya arenaria]
MHNTETQKSITNIQNTETPKNNTYMHNTVTRNSGANMHITKTKSSNTKNAIWKHTTAAHICTIQTQGTAAHTYTIQKHRTAAHTCTIQKHRTAPQHAQYRNTEQQHIHAQYRHKEQQHKHTQYRNTEQQHIHAQYRNTEQQHNMHNTETHNSSTYMHNTDTRNSNTNIHNTETQNSSTYMHNTEIQNSSTYMHNTETQNSSTYMHNTDTRNSRSIIHNAETQNISPYMYNTETQNISPYMHNTETQNNNTNMHNTDPQNNSTCMHNTETQNSSTTWLYYHHPFYKQCESNRSRMESQFADRLFHLEQDFSDEIQTSRQQVEKKITYFRIGRLPDREGHDFGAIYKAMPDARRRFTVKLVQKYAWLKEEMTESVARNVAQYCLSARHLEYLQLNCQTRPQYVGHFLKMVLRSGKQQIENEFLNALQTEGRDGIRFTNEVEQLLVTREKMKAFEDLQTERNQYHISEERLPNVCFHSVEVDILNDHLFSRLFFSYKEHSDIEEYNRSSMFFETFRKCQENVFDAFKCICDTNGIFINGNAQRDNSRITDVIIDEPSTPPSLQTIGIETIHTNEGSLVMILKLTEEHSLTNLKDKCEDGSIGDVLIDLLQRKDVRERLNAGTYDFKMKLHATTEERMCIHPTGEDSKNLSQVHPRRICEELEMSDHLLDILQKGKLVPPDITSKLQVKVNRRDKIHELLRHYDIRKDN